MRYQYHPHYTNETLQQRSKVQQFLLDLKKISVKMKISLTILFLGKLPGESLFFFFLCLSGLLAVPHMCQGLSCLEDVAFAIPSAWDELFPLHLCDLFFAPFQPLLECSIPLTSPLHRKQHFPFLLLSIFLACFKCCHPTYHSIGLVQLLVYLYIFYLFTPVSKCQLGDRKDSAYFVHHCTWKRTWH